MATAKPPKTKPSVKKPEVIQAPNGEKSTTASSAVPVPPAPAKEDSASIEQRVRDAAYRRFEARGFEHGHDEEDWAEAEKEVRPPEGN